MRESQRTIRRTLRIGAAIAVLLLFALPNGPATSVPPPAPSVLAGSVAPSVVNLSAANWAPVNSPTPPPGRWGASMAYDTATGQVILFGGCEITLCPTNDTWAYSKGSWTNLTPTTGPSPRWNAMMASDPFDGGVLLFGGCGLGSCILNDTWLFKGGTWTNVTKGVAPVGRAEAAMAWYPAGNEDLLFGGCEAGSPGPNSCAASDTWVYSLDAWKRIVTPANATPPARYEAALATDGATGGVLLQGGYAFYGGQMAHATIFNDTWEFAGASGWLPIGTGVQPIRAYSPSSAWDNGTMSVILFGGFNGFPNQTVYGSTFSYAASGWTNVSPVVSPPERYAASLAYDVADRQLLLFGGLNASQPTFNDTWVLTVAHYPPPTSAPGSGHVDVGQSVRFTAPPGSQLPNAFYFWTGLPGCLAGNAASFVCRPTYPGRALIAVNVSFPNGSAGTSAPLAFVVDPLLTVTSLASTPRALDVREVLNFSALPSGGTGTYSLSWGGLPPGCVGRNSSSLNCTPTAAGSYTPVVNVTDTNGAFVSGTFPKVTVHAVLSATLTATPGNESFSVRAQVSGGTGPFTYVYQGLPGGCASVNASNLSCQVGAAGGAFALRVTVIDATGSTANSSANVSVAKSPTGTVGSKLPGFPWWGYVAIGGFAVAILAAYLLRKRQVQRDKEHPPPPEPEPPLRPAR